jgi:hypothetical protein
MKLKDELTKLKGYMNSKAKKQIDFVSKKIGSIAIS